jgi:hypothetical protein
MLLKAEVDFSQIKSARSDWCRIPINWRHASTRPHVGAFASRLYGLLRAT